MTKIGIDQRAKLIDKNLELVKHRISEAAEKAGRDAVSIKIIAVTKRMPVEEGETMVRIGTGIFGSRQTD